MELYKNFKPSVSIIIPAFNRAELLGRAIDSVLNQTFENWECLVVDDGSVDNTFEVVNEYLKTEEQIRYMKHRNKKTSLTMNTGILAAAGKYITFLDSDDEYKKEHLQLRVKYMSENPGIDLIQGGVKIIGYPYVKDKNDLSKEIHVNECKIGGTFFGKREVFIEMNGFKDLTYSSDSEFWERASENFNLTDVSVPTYIYHRDTPGSICSNITGS